VRKANLIHRSGMVLVESQGSACVDGNPPLKAVDRGVRVGVRHRRGGSLELLRLNS
jgi:hypothetical protein